MLISEHVRNRVNKRERRTMRWMTKTTAIIWILTVMFLMTAGPVLAAVSDEQLIVFVQSGKSPVDRQFQSTHLPEVRRLAEQMDVAVAVVEAGAGAPGEVAITPLLVYQNFRGRSIYQGRTTTLPRVRNFIRTSRFVPQGEESLQRKQIPVWEKGRTRTWAPIKNQPGDRNATQGL